jgi:hypothetical protein
VFGRGRLHESGIAASCDQIVLVLDGEACAQSPAFVCWTCCHGQAGLFSAPLAQIFEHEDEHEHEYEKIFAKLLDLPQK